MVTISRSGNKNLNRKSGSSGDSSPNDLIYCSRILTEKTYFCTHNSKMFFPIDGSRWVMAFAEMGRHYLHAGHFTVTNPERVTHFYQFLD